MRAVLEMTKGSKLYKAIRRAAIKSPANEPVSSRALTWNLDLLGHCETEHGEIVTDKKSVSFSDIIDDIK